ncbi:hypothetical protein [Colwellia piezophila]|uniref:hypothetical protein n=1 Tax=Colwellia piezophila TaxID=211668 RepID=UPI00035DDCC0|nr:hypothetical protein [Colwellia piezophila]
MKKLSLKQRRSDILRCLRDRKKHLKNNNSSKYDDKNKSSEWKEINRWIDSLIIKKTIKIEKLKRRNFILFLPESLNFCDDYEETALYFQVIRKLGHGNKLSNKAYKLKSVNFDSLKKISTSASLVLTAEISKWEDILNADLVPNIENWQPEIIEQFLEVGFFDLFNNQPELPKVSNTSDLALVKYIKGQCGDAKKSRVLRKALQQLIGDDINKWTFLRSGLDEAITNVSHHAYPEHKYKNNAEKNWYLTGSLNKSTKELKIVFYDQGIGIPNTLKASELWEKIYKSLSFIPQAQRKLDSILIKAAVEVERTSTGEEDRGKGLQDLLEFIKHRSDGYLSIISQRGLYKYSIINGKVKNKSESFKAPILGTLLIWSVTLEGEI